jgi:hypothetical protein
MGQADQGFQDSSEQVDRQVRGGETEEVKRRTADFTLQTVVAGRAGVFRTDVAEGDNRRSKLEVRSSKLDRIHP